MPTAAGNMSALPARGTHALPRRPFARPAPFLKLRANEIEAARAQFFVSASQPTQSQTADPRLNGNPWSVLFGRRAAVPRRLVRTNGGVRRFAKVCRRLFFVDAGRRSAK